MYLDLHKKNANQIRLFISCILLILFTSSFVWRSNKVKHSVLWFVLFSQLIFFIPKSLSSWRQVNACSMSNEYGNEGERSQYQININLMVYPQRMWIIDEFEKVFLIDEYGKVLWCCSDLNSIAICNIYAHFACGKHKHNTIELIINETIKRVLHYNDIVIMEYERSNILNNFIIALHLARSAVWLWIAKCFLRHI